ncbi:phosphatase PAP2 family protein [Caldinitratiruptor microaerophilus]|uniref:phosphatase PAP2 family protein n=1 Tax=Caldinitratiruptor microaerophilus TaxID=671077 RepID=UPI00222ED26C|nr:phosphatase PAP2 family protein [Caldinitratiruptor microaerophilus]
MSLSMGLVLNGVFIAGFVKLAEELLENDLGRFDSAVTARVGQLAHPAVTSFMRLLTWLGSVPATAALTAILAWVLWHRHGRGREALTLLASVAGAAVLDTVLKETFGRARPPGPWLVRAGGFSFPSGHSMVAFALYGYLAYLTWHGRHRPWQRLPLAGALVAVAVLIGVSRIYLGVHYPSDVVAGFAAGGTWVTTCTLIGHPGLRKRSGGESRPRA